MKILAILAFIVASVAQAQVYTYSESIDFPDGACDPGNLSDEIKASQISTDLKSVYKLSGQVRVVFAAELSSGDKTLLDGDSTSPAGGLIAEHDHTASHTCWAMASQLSEVTTDSTDWADLISGPLRMCPGWYKITVSYIAATTDTGSALSLELLKDANSIWKTDEAFPAANTGVEYPRCYVYIGQQSIDEKPIWKLRWKRTGGSGTLSLRKLFLLIERMPPQ